MAAIGANGADFRSLSAKLGERVKKTVSAKVQTYASTLLRELEHDTPILTGQARGSWLVAIGSPSAAMLGPGGLTTSVRDLAHGRPASVDWSASQTQQLAIIATWEPGRPLYIFNNIPYLGRLNRGYSGQAPAGFIEAAVMRASATLKGR